MIINRVSPDFIALGGASPSRGADVWPGPGPLTLLQPPR
jgi:hypothetical protein